jgi:chromate transport protein ChrA
MILGSLIAFLAIFSPGLIIIAGIQGIWHAIRTRRWIKSALRGLNATAVGFVYSAFYRLWQIGLIDKDYRGGRPLGTDPWWVVIVATAYVGGRFYNFPAFPSILLGGVLGLLWYAAIEA